MISSAIHVNKEIGLTLFIGTVHDEINVQRVFILKFNQSYSHGDRASRGRNKNVSVVNILIVTNKWSSKDYLSQFRKNSNHFLCCKSKLRSLL